MHNVLAWETSPKEFLMSDCVNLLELFGKAYRVDFDPAFDPRHVLQDKLDPWMMLLESRLGTIFPHGGNLLAVEVKGRPSVRRKLDALPCCRRCQIGEGYGCWTFPVDCFDKVAAIVKPRRKRAWSDEQRQKAAEQLKANLSKPSESRENPPISTAS
jgi:hypothetical protein